jgi:hypothetical protein
MIEQNAATQKGSSEMIKQTKDTDQAWDASVFRTMYLNNDIVDPVGPFSRIVDEPASQFSGLDYYYGYRHDIECTEANYKRTARGHKIAARKAIARLSKEVPTLTPNDAAVAGRTLATIARIWLGS